MPKTQISNRFPSVVVEYDCFGERRKRHFDNPYKARQFYRQKLRDNKHPTVKKADK